MKKTSNLKTSKLKQKIMAVFMSIICLTMIVPSGVTAFAAPADDDDLYAVTLADCDNGTVTFDEEEGDTAEFAEGEEVALSVTPDDGYQFAGITLTLTETGEVAAEDNDIEDTIGYTFTMPNANMTVEAQFDVSEIEPEESLIVDESGFYDTTDAVIENEIMENVNETYTGEVSGVTLANYLVVMDTLFYSDMVEEGDTIDSIMRGVEQADANAFDKFLASIDTNVALYDTGEDSDYYIALANTMMDTKGVSVFDYVFGYNGTDGTLVDGCIYDKDTGIAYIPKSLFYDEDGTYLIGEIKMQLGFLVNLNYDDMDSTVTSSVFEEGNDVVDVYTQEDNIFDMETTVYAETGLSQDEITVFANGIPLESDDYDYDADTGEVTVNASTASIASLSVSASDDEYGIQTLEHVTKGGMVVPDSWSDVDAVNTTPVKVPSWVTEGTALFADEARLAYDSEFASHSVHAGKTGYGFLWDDDGSMETNYDNTKLIDWIYGEISGQGTSLSDDCTHLYKEDDCDYGYSTHSTIYFSIDFKNSDFQYANQIQKNEGGAWETVKLQKSADGKDHTGESFSDLSGLGALYMKCAHLGEGAGTYIPAWDDGYHDLPCFARVVRQSTDEKGVDYIMLAVVTATVDAQTGFGVFRINTQPSSGYLALKKVSADTSMTSGNNHYSYSGAEYTVYTNSDCTTKATTASGGSAVLTTTDGGGSNTLEMEQGTYYVKETKASTGFDLDTTVHTIEVTADNTSDNPATFTSSEPPKFGYIDLYKSSEVPNISDDNNCYTLEGAKYTITNESGSVVETLTTNKEGYAKSGKLPLGDYVVKEIEASEGFKLDENTYNVTVSASDCTSVASTTHTYTKYSIETPGNDPLGISLYKLDIETGDPVTLGAGELEGAQFTVKYYDGYYLGSDEYDTSKIPEGDAKRTWVLETKWNEESGQYIATLLDTYKVSGNDWYYTETGGITCPLGTYTVQETKEPTGYLLEDAPANSKNWVSENTYEAPVHVGEVTLDNNTVRNFHIGNEPNNEHTADEQVKRYDIMLEKHNGETQESMGSIEFSLTSLTTGESHNFWTDEHGNYTSNADTNPHSYHTNEAIDEHSGLWFYGTENEEDGAPVDDSLGALPYDSYRLDEIEGENNAGYEMIHMTFTVGDSDYSGEVIDLGMLNNYPPEEPEVPEPYLHSKAWAGDTGTNLCYAGSKEVTLYDDVWYYDLEPGTYYLYGVAYDMDSGEPEVDNNGDTICAVTEFTVEDGEEDTDDMIVQEFNFDIENLAGHRDLFYESIYTLDEDENPVLICAEGEEDYEAQTIYFPNVHTTLTEISSSAHIALAGEEITLTDKVSVIGVPEGCEMTLSGTLMLKSTGEALVDTNGDPVAASTTFTSTGLDEQFIDLDFTFDASALAGDAVVAYEDLYYNTDEDAGVLVGRHADLDDEDQTVVFPEIHTEATDAADGDKIMALGVVTVNDTVDYTNLELGRTYKMVATLMDATTGEAVMYNGEEVTNELNFKPDEADGSVEVSLTFDTTDYAGHDLVVFEKCYALGDDDIYYEVGNHEDLTDEGQTVTVETPVPDTPVETPPTETPTTIKTGQAIGGIIAAIAAVLAITGIVIVARRRRRV